MKLLHSYKGPQSPSKGADVSGVLQTRISGWVRCVTKMHIHDCHHQYRVHATQVQLSQLLASHHEGRRAERNATHHKNEFKIVDKGPANSVTIFLILLLIFTAFDECLTDETVHR